MKGKNWNKDKHKIREEKTKMKKIKDKRKRVKTKEETKRKNLVEHSQNPDWAS